MFISFLFSIFAAKITKINEMDKENRENCLIVDVFDYYENLSRADRGRFINYLSSNLEISHSSVTKKLTKTMKLKLSEVIAISLIIKNELWKESNSMFEMASSIIAQADETGGLTSSREE